MPTSDFIDIEPGMVKSVSSEELDMTQISMEDKDCFQKLNDFDVFGIFQFETPVALGVIKEIGIDSFKDMYAATTLGRPDPLSCKLHVKYGQRKRGEEYWEPIPAVAEIMDQSYNLPIFQESSMLLSRKLAGFSGGEANALRKGLAKGKDNEETMKKLKKILKDFKERSQISVEKGLISQEQLDIFIETLESFGGYGFNLSHAVSYAMVAYWSLYLKTHFPVQFMVALLNFTDLAKKDNKGTVVLKKYIQHAKKMGVKISAPNINTSETNFSLDGNTIRWGLGMIKGLGDKAVENMIDKKPFDSLEDFISKVEKRKVNKSKVITLIKVGAFDAFGDREYLINKYLAEILKEKKYEYVKFGEVEKREAEEELLGMAISFSVISDEVYDNIKEYNIMKLGELDHEEEGVFLGKIGKLKKMNSKKSGNPMMIVEIFDDFDEKSFFVWEKYIEEFEKIAISGHIMTVPLKKFDLNSDGCFFSGDFKNLLDLSD